MLTDLCQDSNLAFQKLRNVDDDCNDDHREDVAAESPEAVPKNFQYKLLHVLTSVVAICFWLSSVLHSS